MRAVIFSICFWLWAPFNINAQKKQAAVWYYGDLQKISFLTNPITISKAYFGGADGTSSICDSNGNYLFSCNGIQVTDRRDSLMTNGFIINPLFSEPPNFVIPAGCNVIIPFLHNPYLYHIYMVQTGAFNFSEFGYENTALCHRVVDMRLNGGLGAVLPVDDYRTVLLKGVALQITCALHANGKDTWLISRKRDTDSLMAWLVSDTGFTQLVYSKTHSPVRKPNILSASNQIPGFDALIKTSPDSRMLFVPRRTYGFPYHELYRFNRETGVFYNPIYIKDSTNTAPDFYINGFPDGCFSPDSRRLYTGMGTRSKLSVFDQTDEGKGTLWQYDVSQHDSLSIAQSKVFVGRFGRIKPNKWLNPPAPRMQLAMNGKIYLSPGCLSVRDTFLTVLNCPNSPGYECNIEWRKHKMLFRTGAFFPTLNQTFIRNAGIFQVQASKRKICVGDTLELSGYGAGAEHFHWQTGSSFPTGVLDTLTTQRFAVKPEMVGMHTFKCFATGRCMAKDSFVVVEILPLPPKPVFATLKKPVPCKGDTAFVSIQNAVPGYHYQWNTGDTTTSIQVDSTGLYFLNSTATDQGCVLKGSDTVSLVFNPAAVPKIPMLLSPALVEVCEGQTTQLTVGREQLTVKYKWSNGAEGDSVLVDGGKFSAISETAEGCTSASSDTVEVRTYPYPKPTLVNVDTVLKLATLQNRNYCVSGLPGSTFSFTVEGGTAVDSSEDCITVNWLPGVVSRHITATETRKEAPCSGSATQVFTYRPNLNVPTLITPNSDGHNDAFVVQDLEFYASHRLQIFDRWGKKVVDTTVYKQDWKGDVGIYFYNLVVDGNQYSGWLDVAQ